jgi:hypothetical protein
MSQSPQRPPSEDDWKYAERSMAWHGWGSPVGLGIILISLGVTAVLIRIAVLGF